ncbi:P-loop NTPase [uncultured Jatrophihabitans sp.]|uniref:P-loop NTPase n=1 Tax=uncultured Jatrophihabitans sp. TaxID=1610747 RepID=UPI0035CB9DC2
MISRTAFVIVCGLVGLLAAGIDLASTQKTYQAHAQIFATAVTDSSANANILYSASMYAQSRVQSYTTVPTSPSVVRPVKSKLHLSLSTSALAGEITANAPLNLTLLNIAVKDSSPARAARIADAVASQTIVVIQRLEAVSTTTDASTLKLTVVHPPNAPAAPVAPRPLLLLLVGLLAGLIVGLAVVVVRERIRPRVRSAVDVESATDAPVLCEIPSQRPGTEPAAFMDAYRRLAAFVVHPRAAELAAIGGRHDLVSASGDGTGSAPPPTSRVLAVVGAGHGAGASSVAVNLSKALAEAGRQTCLVDLDLRKPSVGREFELPDRPGGAAVITGKTSLDEALARVGDNLAVLPAGGPTTSPGELLSSPALREAIEQLRGQFEFVIIDSGSLIDTADGLQAVLLADEVLVVVAARRTSLADLTRAADAAARVGRPASGVVANRTGPTWATTRRLGMRPLGTSPTGEPAPTLPADARSTEDGHAVIA